MTISTRKLRVIGVQLNKAYEIRGKGILVVAADHIDAQAAEIKQLREALTELIAICEPNLYPCPDKPNSKWGKLQAAKAALTQQENT